MLDNGVFMVHRAGSSKRAWVTVHEKGSHRVCMEGGVQKYYF